MNLIWVSNKFQEHNAVSEYIIVIYLMFAVIDKFMQEGCNEEMKTMYTD